MKIYCVRLPRLAARSSRIGIGTLVALSAAILAGCGGGGGGSSSGGGGSSSSSEIFSGTVTNSTANVAAAGYTVRFNDISSVSSVTSSTGSFSISVPSSDITGNDQIFVVDQSNNVQATSSPLTGDGNGLRNIAITIGPPPAGGVPLYRKQ